MAMIGRGAAIAEVGPHHHEMHGVFAFSAWLGVHSLLMTGVRNRIDAFINWGWDYFSTARGPQVLDRSDAARIDWDEDSEPRDRVRALRRHGRAGGRGGRGAALRPVRSVLAGTGGDGGDDARLRRRAPAATRGRRTARLRRRPASPARSSPRSCVSSR